MEVLRRPPRVRPGDVVAVVSPGFGAVGRWPHRVERATAYLDSLGLRVRVMPNAGRSEGWASAPPEDRAADLHAAFADDEVALVLASIGGEPMVDEPATEWTEEFLDWDAQLDSTRARTLLPGEGWVAIRGGTARGPILAGCLETICWHLKGSSAWIDPAGAILLLETSEEAPSPAHVDAYLTDLEQLGVFESAAAVVFGRPKGYAAEDVKLLWEVVARRTETAGLPVLANVDAGHTDPMLTMPIGVEAELDADAPSFRLLEPATPRFSAVCSTS